MSNKLVAKIEHHETGNIIYCLDGKERYEQFNCLKSKCEVCNTIRYRNISYIIENESGDLIQCGSDCFKKLLSDKLSIEEQAICQAYNENEFYNCWSNGMLCNRDKLYYIPMNVLLAYIHTNKSPKDDFDPIEKWREIKPFINDNDKKIANEVLNWYKNYQGNNSFINNIKVLLEEEFTRINTIRIFKYVYKVYKDTINYENLNANTGLNNNVFTIKKIWIEKEGTDYSYSYYGTTYTIYRMLDENNNIIELKTSSTKDYLEFINKKVECVIKNSYSSRNGKITKISRMKELK